MKACDLLQVLHKSDCSRKLKEVLLLQLPESEPMPAEVQILQVWKMQGESLLSVGDKRVYKVFGLLDGKFGPSALILIAKLNMN